MKKFAVLFVLVFALAMVFVSCDGGSNDTELAFINGDPSNNVNDIVWENDSITWSKTDGYNPAETTESKQIATLTSDVSCYWIGIGPSIAYFEQTGDASLTLNEGSSNVFTIERP